MAAPDECAHAGEQLVEGERLDEIIVGSSIQTDDALMNAVTSRDHENRNVDLFVSEPRQYLQTAEIWKPQIQKHEVEGLGRDAGIPVLACSFDDNVVVFGLKPFLDRVSDLPLVFDHQDAHSTSSVCQASVSVSAASAPTASGDVNRLSLRPMTLHERTSEVTHSAVPPNMKAMTTMSHNGR